MGDCKKLRYRAVVGLCKLPRGDDANATSFNGKCVGEG